MEKHIIGIFLIVFLLNGSCYGQSNNASVNRTFIFPVFIDSTIFEKQVRESEEIKSIYKAFKKQWDYDTYYYEFKISRKGRVIAKQYDSDSIYSKLNTYIDKVFNKNKWQPGYENENAISAEISYGIMNIIFVPMNKEVKVQIVMSNGIIGSEIKGHIIYNKRIPMESN